MLNDPAGQRHWQRQEPPLLAIGVPVTTPPMEVTEAVGAVIAVGTAVVVTVPFN